VKIIDPDDSDLKQFSERLRERAFDPSCCFLCARHFDDVHLTDEHVIPKWAQRRFNLWNEKLTILNKTEIPYKLLTVPCCEECNKYRLQPIETSVSSAVRQGSEALQALGANIIFLWLGKIFYGILYRELSLLLNRKESGGLTIVTPDILREYEMHLFLLQQAREKVQLVDFNPGSIYVFRCQSPLNPQLQWDLCDNVQTLFIGIRMADVGVIGVLGDGGAQMIYSDEYAKLKAIPLHPIQFRELCAHFSYRSSIATRTPKYITAQGQPHQVYQMPLGGLSMKPYFEEWEEDIYGKFLSHYTGLPYEMVYQGPHKVMTWLHDDSGNIRYLDCNKYP